MNPHLQFVETTIFTKQFSQIATDDDLKTLQNELILNPEKGVLIQDTGGLRKIRLAIGSNKGKSAGARIIYFLVSEERIYLLSAYAKSVKVNLTDKDKVNLKKVTEILKKEACNGFL